MLLDPPSYKGLLGASLLHLAGCSLDLGSNLLQVVQLTVILFLSSVELLEIVLLRLLAVMLLFCVDIDLQQQLVDFFVEKLLAFLRVFEFLSCVFAHQQQVLLLSELRLLFQHFRNFRLSLSQSSGCFANLLL